MKYSLLILLSCSVATLLQAQKKTERKQVDEFIGRFNQKLDTVYWLCDYDNIAWWTSDSVFATPKEEQAKLGSEWFCFKQKNIWHAAYGKYENGNYEIIYHYTVDTNRVIKRIYDPIDTSLSNSFSRALINGSNYLNQYPDSIKVRFNQYIRRESNNNLTVWFLPAFTAKGIAVYGGEFIYTFDPTGNILLSKSEYSQGYKGFKPDPKKEIWLNYTSVDEPTIGSVFFVWYYRTYFDRIIIDSKKYKSSVFHNDNEYSWVHAKKE
mgnify:CR=1 FL=1